MRGLGAGLGNDTDDILLLDTGGHRGGQLADDQHGALGRVADLDLLYAEEDREQAVADILDVGGTLHGQVVTRRREHIDEHLADLLDSRLSALVRLDQVLDLALHKGIGDDRDMTL